VLADSCDVGFTFKRWLISCHLSASGRVGKNQDFKKIIKSDFF